MVPQYHRRNVRLITALAGALLIVPATAAELAVPPIVGDGISLPLTATPGDARRGKVISANSDRGNCLTCHALPIPEAPVFGDLGPSLHGVGERLTAAQIRLRLVDLKRLNPDSVMPAYHRIEGLHRVAASYAGQPILSAQDIEDVIAYLLTVTGP